MTRTAESLFDGSSRHELPSFPVQLELDEVSWKIERHAETLRLRGPDLHDYGAALARARARGDSVDGAKLLSGLPVVERRIVLVTGSHHYLAFWVEKGTERELRQLPFVYRLHEKQWLPRREVFLQPPDALDHVARFNANCIQCHTVAGQPRQREGEDAVTGEFWERFDSRIADLGISCEACHGPAEDHVRLLSAPWARHLARNASSSKYAPPSEGVPEREHQSTKNPTTLFVPSTETPEKSTAVCAQCHSYFLPRSAEKWWEHGFSRSFRPGDSVDSSRQLLTPELLTRGDEKGGSLAFSGHAASVYWKNGSIMIGGREANGLLESPCAKSDGSRPTLTCVHCHSMHDGPPDGQLDPQLKSQDAACTQCHSMPASHSAHAPDSSGSRCIACHMPATSYALLSSIVSHKIIVPPRLGPSATGSKVQTPSASELAEAPHACMLCHTDKSREWIRGARNELWPAPEDAASNAIEETRGRAELSVPWAIERALSDNAAVRAVLLFGLSSPQALATGGLGPLDTVLPRLEKDDIAAVRHIAARAAKRREAWIRETGAAELGASQSSPLNLNPALLNRWFEERDRSPVTISE